MCGIAGIFNPQTGIDHALGLMKRMLHSLRHRGPDDQDIQVMDGCVFGHRRLSVIDIDGGRQPIANEDQTKFIVCNGEIYNYQPLRQELIDKGHRFRTRSDSEVILHLYEEEGAACLNRLRGMFALAIYDQSNQHLFCARDHLGQKPFYYHQDGPSFAFASEIKGLKPALRRSVELNDQALLQYLCLRIVAPPRSMFKGIEQLPPGHYLTVDPHQAARIKRYWDLSFEPKDNRSDADLVDELDGQLTRSVKAHLVSDVEVGAFLSGGLDSTLVAAIAAQQLGAAPLPTFTFGIPYGGYNEAHAARAVAERYQTEHHEDEVVPSLQHHLPELVACLDEPSDPLSVCSYLISRMAARRVKVVLGGDGGDELFGGYDRYYGHRYAGIYARIPALLRRGLLGPALSMLPDGRWYKSIGHQLKWLHEGSFQAGGERHAANLGFFYCTPKSHDILLGDQLQATARSFDPYGSIIEAYERAQADDPLDRMLCADSQVRLPAHSVMILDRTSMAHGLEARSPFMDHTLAEFCATLPSRLKVDGRGLRIIQRKLAERYLPRTVLARKKQGFASALPYLLRDEYNTLFDCFLQRSELAAAGYLKQTGIDQLRAAHKHGSADHGQRLWLLLNAEAWYRMHIQDVGIAAMHDMIANTART